MTLFEKILAGEIPSEKVYEDDFSYAFRDISPQAPVHVLVIPKTKARNIEELSDLSPELLSGYFQGLKKTIQALELEEGYRVVFNTGEWGGQTVDYVHAHILGKRQMKWPPG